ncbi:DUF6603 domain-containing protein [Moorena sp. SIO4G3]|uniref:DUF6603 domain-containing protein n=1 Tax=Moorena sp. SIO4G3 TaxID=2607821 RepID=UPI00142B1502|nr:DUF6603 domain-containing protein [Moorena sp. SIO4G3]NEO79492.1 hypothetical protein [Moorena sp. SIO4G3]
MLEQLLEALRKQVQTSSSIVFNEELLLPPRELERISQVFLLKEDEYLTVSDINDIPDPQVNTIEIPTGKTTLLQRADIETQVVFEVDGDDVQCQIVLKLEEGWSFKDSFPSLSDIFPFNDDVIVFSDSYFIYSSQAQSEYPPWSDRRGETISLEPGLNLASWLTLDILRPATNWLEEIIDKTTQYKSWGGVAPNHANPYPVMRLELPLTQNSFDIVEGLSLAQPALVIEITEPVDLIQDIDLRLVASTEDLEFGVIISQVSPGLTFNAESIDDGFSVNDILSLPGGENFQQFIPDELTDAFETCVLKQYSVVVAEEQNISFISLSVGTAEGDQWSLIQNAIVLENITLEIELLNPFIADSFTTVFLGATCQFFPDLFPGSFSFELELDNGGSGGKWEISSIRGSYFGSVSLNDLVTGIIGNGNVPDEIGSIIFSDFGIEVTQEGQGYSYSFYGRCEAIFSILDTQLISALSVVYDYSQTTKEMNLLGTFLIEEQNFSLELKLSSTSDSVLTASWESMDEEYLGIEDIAEAFGFDEIPSMPPEFDFSMRSASLTYDFTNKELAIALVSVNYGSMFFVAKIANSRTRLFLFGVTNIGGAINLSNLPLVGDLLPKDQVVGIENLQIVVASQNLNEQEVLDLNSLLPSPAAIEFYYTSEGINKGLSIAASLVVGAVYQETLFLPVVDRSSPSKPPSPTKPGGNRSRVTTTSEISETTPGKKSPITVADNAVWLKMERAFGPVYFNKVGLQYRNGEIHFAPEIALIFRTFSFFLNEVSVGSPLTDFTPSFYLDGFELEYQSGAIEIGGAFLRSHKGGYDEYAGMALLKLSFGKKSLLNIGLSAIAAYADKEPDPSFFLYAVLDCPLGGLPFLFFTGASAGFGYNYSLRVPPIEEISQFPLVSEAIEGNYKWKSNDISSTVSSQLEELNNYIAVAAGAGFLAVGIKFTSFKLLDCFGLLTVAVDNAFEMNLIGSASLIVPAATNKAHLIHMEMLMKTTFSTKEGVLSIEAQLAEGSYIFSKSCHLTGGYAAYIWFAGEHEGDFVISLGGYHPDFQRPSHYPVVPRVGCNWKLGPMSIKGEIYVALCAHAVMAGGDWGCEFRAGPAYASYRVYADFLISWKPYYYDISLGINARAGFGFLGPLQVGTDLRMWGPDFGGFAKIHVFLFSFNIEWGDQSAQSPEAIDWNEFQQSFLPADTEVCNITVNEGLVKEIKKQENQEGIAIVNPKEFEILTDSFIPFKTATQGNRSATVEIGETNTAFGIHPMAVKGEELTSSYNVTITLDGDDVTTDMFALEPVTKRFPSNVWGQPDEEESNQKVVKQPGINDPQFVENTLSGFRIVPAVQPPVGKTEDIEAVKLQYDVNPVPGAYAWNDIDPFLRRSNEQGRERIEHSVVSNPERDSILSALGFDPDTDVNVTGSVADEFVIVPQVGISEGH